MDRKGKWTAQIAACGVLLALAMIYAVCYVQLSHPQPFTVRTISGDEQRQNRLYTHRWLAIVFWPGTCVESLTTGVETNIGLIEVER